MRPRTGLFAVLAGATAAIVACSAPPVIAADLAEKGIRDGLETKGLTATVVCPAEQPAKAGQSFTCTATTKAGEAVPVDVTVLDESGRTDWKLRGVVIHEKLMGDGIAAGTNGAIRVSCPDKVAVIAVGSSFECEAGSGSSTQHMKITIVDAAGNETWQLEP